MHLHMSCMRHQPFSTPAAPAHYPPDLGLETVHLDIALRVAIDSKTAAGVVTHTLRAARDGVRKLELNAVDLDIEMVVSDHGLSHSYNGQRLTIRFSEPMVANERRDVAIHYSVTEPVTGLSFSSTHRFAATDHETERARHWLPCVDLPAVRPTLHWHLRADRALTIVANGAEGDTELHPDGTKTVHWKLDHPCPSYLACFAIGEFIEVDDGVFNGIPIRYFTTTNYAVEDLTRAFGRTGQMLAWMTSKLKRPFPYPKYYQFAVPGVGGAMENISLVSWDAKLLLDADAAREWTRLLDIINVHEMGHSYFGDLITCRDFAHAWLKESWATYLEHAWLEDTYGDDELRYELERSRRDYFGEADSKYTRPLVMRRFDSSWQMYDHHLYPGGALRLHLLRKTLGDDAFWSAVAQYVADYADDVVETDDFRRTLERASGRSLGKFFDQWIHSPGYPKLDVTFEFDSDARQGTFTIKQTQIDDSKGIKAFEFDLELGWTCDPTATSYDRETVTVDAAKHVVVVPMASEPIELRVDPEATVPARVTFNPGHDKLLRQLKHAPDITGRIHAGATLLKGGRRKGVAAVADAWDEEPFYGVRVFWAEALGRCHSQSAITLLTRLVNTEQHGHVLEPLFNAAKKYRDPALAAAICQRLDRGDLPHRATMAALVALGCQRDPQHLTRLSEAARHSDGFNGVRQSGAILGLGELRSEAALDEIRKTFSDGRMHHLAEPSAVTAMANCAIALPRERRDQSSEWLIDLLRHPNPRVQMAAVSGLEILGAANAVAALEGFAATLAVQDRVTVERTIARLGQATAHPTQALSEELERLQGAVRELRDELDLLSAKHETNAS